MPARLFVALELGGEDRRALVAWAREAVAADRALRIVAAESVHLTLAFLGSLPVEEIGPLSLMVEELEGWPAPPLSTGAALWLSPRHPHVLAVAVADDGGALGALHGAVWDGLEALGYEREVRSGAPWLDAVAGRAAPDAGAAPRRRWGGADAVVPRGGPAALRGAGACGIRSRIVTFRA
jgi:2'-5' RNA ligase